VNSALPLAGTDSHPRSVGRRTAILRSPAARVVAVWGLLAVLAAAQFVAEITFLHRGWTAGDLVARLSMLPLWALATPFILRAGRRFPLAGPALARNLALHLASGTAFLLLANLAVRLPMVLRGAGFSTVADDALAGFLHFFPGGIVVYAAIVALGGWRSGGASTIVATAVAAPSSGDEAVETMVTERPGRPVVYPEVVPVKTALRTHLVPAAEIDWIEGDGDHVVLHRGGEAMRTRSTLKALARSLDPARFVRVHRSAVVRLGAIREIQPYFHGDFVVILHGGATIRLARSRRRDVEALLGNRL
jgi:hypothetical protein